MEVGCEVEDCDPPPSILPGERSFASRFAWWSQVPIPDLAPILFVQWELHQPHIHRERV